MQNLIDEYRRCPTVENAKLLREYFERNPSRVWVLRSELLHVLAAAGVGFTKNSIMTKNAGRSSRLILT